MNTENNVKKNWKVLILNFIKAKTVLVKDVATEQRQTGSLSAISMLWHMKPNFYNLLWDWMSKQRKTNYNGLYLKCHLTVYSPQIPNICNLQCCFLFVYFNCHMHLTPAWIYKGSLNLKGDKRIYRRKRDPFTILLVIQMQYADYGREMNCKYFRTIFNLTFWEGNFLEETN